MRIIKEITMTIKQQEWIDAYNQALKANVDLLHKTKQIPGNAEVFTQYSQQIASEMFNKGMTPEDAANYAAMSLVRRPLLDEIQKLTIKRRMTTDPAEQSKLDERISLDQQKYNKIMGMKCFEAAQTTKPLTEGVELPNMICFGRGYWIRRKLQSYGHQRDRKVQQPCSKERPLHRRNQPGACKDSAVRVQQRIQVQRRPQSGTRQVRRHCIRWRHGPGSVHRHRREPILSARQDQGR